MTKNSFRILSSATALATILSACVAFDTMELRNETVKRLAMPSNMHNRVIHTPPFDLTAYERIHDQGGDATIYIEGDGLAWVSRSRPSMNPTPKNPVALHLATRDTSPNVIYLARPCQYTGLSTPKPCPMKYWTSHRFAPEVIDSANAALDNIKAQYGIKRFNLVGFSGGGAVAALVAGKRNDVASLRTVGGNLDHARVNRNHNVSQMAGSLNAVDVAGSIAHIPQHHFIGNRDKVITPDIYDSFKAAAGPSSCMRSIMVKDADHETGWVSAWPTSAAMPGWTWDSTSSIFSATCISLADGNPSPPGFTRSAMAASVEFWRGDSALSGTPGVFAMPRVLPTIPSANSAVPPMPRPNSVRRLRSIGEP